MDTANPHNSILVSELELAGAEVSAHESLLESAPQLLLQIYIILETGKISKILHFTQSVQSFY